MGNRLSLGKEKQTGEITIGPYNIQMRACLGRGSFGDVYKAIQRRSNNVVAAKRIIASADMQEFTKQEIETMRKVKGHVNVLSILGDYEEVTERGMEYWIITEYCSLGNLDEYSKTYCIEDEHKVHIMHQVVSALAYLHGIQPHGVMHRDVKPENVLFMLKGKLHLLKLCDFGVSKVVVTLCRGHLSTVVGTRPYMAPEFFRGEDVHYEGGGEIDGYAAGIMFHQLLEVLPGKGMECKEVTEQILGKIIWNRRYDKWYPVEIKEGDSPMVRKMKEVVLALIKVMPHNRISMKDAEQELKQLKAHLSKPFGTPKPNLEANVASRFQSKQSSDIDVIPDEILECVKYPIESHIIDSLRLTLGKENGRDYFGSVFVGRLQSSSDVDKEVTVHTCPRESNEKLCSFLDSHTILGKFNHENIIPLLGIVIERNQFCAILPKEKELLAHLQNPNIDLQLTDLIRFMQQVAKAVAYMHAKHFILVFISPRRCLINNDNVVKLSDIDDCVEFEEGCNTVPLARYKPMPIRWMPPESLIVKIISASSDVWALGICLWEVITRGLKPYPGMNNTDIMQYIKNGHCMEQPALCPDELYSIMTDAWKTDKEERPKMEEMTARIDNLLIGPEITSDHDECNALRGDREEDECEEFLEPTYNYVIDVERKLHQPIDTAILVHTDQVIFSSVDYDLPFEKVFVGYLVDEVGDEYGNPVTIRCLKKRDGYEQQGVVNFLNGLTIMTKLKHENIAQLIGILFKESLPCAVFPNVQNISFRAYLKSADINFSVINLMHCIFQAAKAMEYIHTKEILLVFLSTNACSVRSDQTLQISTFDSALCMDDDKAHAFNLYLPVRWMAPEQLIQNSESSSGNTFTRATDVWSFSIFMWEVFSRGRNPYPGVRGLVGLKEFLSENKRMERPSACPAVVYDIMAACWHTDPTERPLFGEILQMVDSVIHG